MKNNKAVDLKVNLGKTKDMKCEARFGPSKTWRKWPCGVCGVECVGKALVQLVLSAVTGFIEGVVVYLVNCRMRLVSDAVLMGSCLRSCGHEGDND